MVSGLIPITTPMSLSVFSIPKSGQSNVAFSIGISVRFCLGGRELVGGCWVQLGLLVRIAGFVVVVGLIGDRF